MLLSIGKFSYKLIFQFLYAICTFLKTLTYSEGDLKNPYVTLLFFSLAQLSMGIFEIVTQLRLKNVRKQREKDIEKERINLNSLAAEQTNNTMNSIHAQKEIKELRLTPRIIAQLFFLAFFNSFFALIVFAFEHLEALSKYNFQYEIKFIGFFYVIVLCSYAFKTEFHKHHNFAIIVIISLEIVLSVFWKQRDNYSHRKMFPHSLK